VTAVAWREPRTVLLSEAKDLARTTGFWLFPAGFAAGHGVLDLTLAREHTIQAGLSVAGDACGRVFLRGRRHLACHLTARLQPAAPHTL